MAAPVAAISSELIERFQLVTGSNAEQARSLLEVCNGNLEMAIGMHLDIGHFSMGAVGGSAPSPTVAQPPSEPADSFVDDDVRAPIPQKQEILVENPTNFIGFRGRRKRGETSVFDGFRDFQKEARIQEERVQRLVLNGPSTSQSTQEDKRGRLEDLFRPPIELMYTGTFDGAKEHGVAEHKWLMVNVQNVQEFCCQMLNRDVWSNDAVKSIVREHFILWQVYHDSAEGQRFDQFYGVSEWPYIAILDPRTGENIAVWNKVDAMAFCDLAIDFLTNHHTMDGSASTTPAKRPRLADCIVDADEDSQLAVAIRQSLRDVEVAQRAELSDDNSDCELETFSDSDSEQSMAKQKSIKTSASKRNADQSPESCRQNGKPLKWKSFDANESSSSGRGSGISFLQSLKNIAKFSIVGSALSEFKDEEEVEKPVDEGSSSACWQRLLGPNSDPVTRLVLRLPDGGRLELKWPCTTPVEALQIYARFMGYPSDRYELLTNYPRRFLNASMAKLNLKEAGLHPQETVFIQEKDS